MFVNEDCIESRSDVDDLTTRDCLYDESRPVRYEGCYSLITEDGNLVVAFSVRFDGEGWEPSTLVRLIFSLRELFLAIVYNLEKHS